MGRGFVSTKVVGIKLIDVDMTSIRVKGGGVIDTDGNRKTVFAHVGY